MPEGQGTGWSFRCGYGQLSPRGSALLYVIASIALLGALGGGVAYFSSSSSTSQVATTRADQAYYGAFAGQNYVVYLNKNYGNPHNDTTAAALFDNYINDLNNGGGSYTVNGAQTFTITATKQPEVGNPYGYRAAIFGSYIDESGRKVESFQINEAHNADGDVVGGADNPFENILAGDSDIQLPEDQAYKTGAESAHGADVADKLIDVVTEGHVDYTGTSYIRLGNQTTQGYACLWFNDSKTVQGDTTYCRNGVCKFGKGFRLYFQFQVVSPGADGFTLSFVNASNNTINDCGGDLDMGELLAYGGPGVSGHGLRPAKIALEIDTYQNGTSSCGVSGSRYDDDDGHLAYVYWGQIDGILSGNGCRTYDDNRHGVTGGTNSGLYNIDGNWDWGFYWDSPLRNTQNLDNLKLKTGSTITYKRVANIEDNAVHSIRMEVERSTNTNGTGAYTLKTWYDCTVGDEPCEGLTNLREDMTSKSPDLKSAFTMDAYFHNLLTTFLLGFTQATGANAQEVRVMNFKLRFRE
ncbi:hypothetical protein [Desulfolutivibrio sulfoxidireducens]|uniref:hypothetical protein n=1 Tax=Desulfolutivibrio sulfoxidireducens TaxID=2773299 RepID=UPI00159D669F|nr:hypothetical protein [Desulfolutivibrio sulfoxidireducens]QLA19374.1 hypothetical protein GD604_06250 [Desulfolutivibrio sulfoxidireducens]